MVNKISYDMNSVERDMSGKTIAEIRAELGEMINIAPGAIAKVNGVEAGDCTQLGDGERLIFVKKAGEKGSR